MIIETKLERVFKDDYNTKLIIINVNNKDEEETILFIIK